jgi:hypothetical protein
VSSRRIRRHGVARPVAARNAGPAGGVSARSVPRLRRCTVLPTWPAVVLRDGAGWTLRS